MSLEVQIDDSLGDRQQFTIETKVDVSQNEPMISHVMNRGINTLIQNDMNLNAMYKAVFSKLSIVDYIAGDTYASGDLVWWLDPTTKQLYLLRCVIPGNDNDPADARKDGVIDDNELKALGWVNENPKVNILSSSVMNIVTQLVQSYIDDHQADESMHPYGKISSSSDSSDYIGTKLLKSSLENIDVDRSTTFFPQTVVKLDEGDAVICGYCRQYGSIIEYDIVFRLGSTVDYNLESSTGAGLQAISSNVVVFQSSDNNIASFSFQNNSKYFTSTQDMDIFQTPAGVSIGKCKKGLLVQMNRNDYVNTYSAKIQFPYAFSDTRYSVMANSMLSQTNGDASMVPSANDIAFCDKTKNSITVLDITFPDSRKYGSPGYNTSQNGIVVNSFHLKAIGMANASTGA